MPAHALKGTAANLMWIDKQNMELDSEYLHGLYPLFSSSASRDNLEA
jgi:hypothetical protein